MDLASRIDNASLAIANAIAATDARGRDVALIVARLCWELDPAGAAHAAAAPIRWGDERREGGTLVRPSDHALDKPGTDVGLVGTMWPTPRATQAVVSLDVGGTRKAIRVVGERVFEKSWRGAVAPSPPAPLGPTPLVYELAYGGVVRDGLAATHEILENPVGRGLAASPEHLVGKPAPQLEPIEEGASELERATACFAPIPSDWQPRRRHAGTFDDAWQKKRAPLPPADADPRANHWSAVGLHQPRPLAPNAPVEVLGVRPEGPWRFRAPAYSLRMAATIDGVRSELATHLDGFLIDVDRAAVELTFRAVVRLPRPWDRLDAISVWGVGDLPDSAFVPRTRPKEASP